jgi:hypothetical protein
MSSLRRILSRQARLFLAQWLWHPHVTKKLLHWGCCEPITEFCTMYFDAAQSHAVRFHYRKMTSDERFPPNSD